MRLATVRYNGATRAARLVDGGAVLFDAPDVGTLLARGGAHDGAGPFVEGTELCPLLRVRRAVCVGLNYRSHILEMGRDVPAAPTLFAKYPEAFCGARDAIALPPESHAVDWEGELVVVIGRSVRRAGPEEAARAIAGFTVANDVTMRDWQRRTVEWLQGKTWDASTPLGAVLTTVDEVGAEPDLPVRTLLNGEVVQQGRTSDLVFGPVALVSYISTFMALRAGDVILTGTPGGVGDARVPPVYVTEGDRVRVEIEPLGCVDNVFCAPPVDARMEDDQSARR
ncbi:MAG TPA: fumarylacetoacetate hydrolase family protein [Acidimicrobiales bacterium]|nr:fumarylacetoacetate hydrolase family protein [Acidimicrobiales bacterium]